MNITKIKYIWLALFILVYAAVAQNYEVTKINFVGNTNFSKEQLLDIIRSEEDENFDERLVKLDKIILTNFYRQNGFLTVEVRDSLRINQVKKTAILNYIIDAPFRYRLKEVRFSGNKVFSDSSLMSVFNIYPLNSYFNEGRINIARNNIEDKYYNIGKPFVDIGLDYRFEQDSLVIVLIDIKENHTVFIENIQYVGLRWVQKFIIRRELELKKGERYNREKMTASQKNIYSTGLFDYVRFEIVPKPKDTVNVDLKILVRERDPRWVGVRAGYAYEQEESYGNQFEFTLEGGHRNLFGTARSLSLHLIPSFWFDIQEKKIVNVENQVTLSFVEPWVFYTRTPLVFQVSYNQYTHLNSADFNVFRTTINLSHRFDEKVEVTGTIGAKFIDQLTAGYIDTTLDTDLGKKDQIYSISLYGKQDKRNNYFNPTQGLFMDGSITFSKSFGEKSDGSPNNVEYFTLISAWKRYQPLKFKFFGWKPNITLASRVKAGSILELGNTQTIPISDLFFAGGATTVRGYPEQLLGPGFYDASGKKIATGGKLLFLTNAELRFPLIWLFMGEIFVDGGNVWKEINQFDYKEIRFSTGLGLALLTPFGPIRFDYGWKLQPEPQENNVAYHIGFHFAF